MNKPVSLDLESAETVALKALKFLAEDTPRLGNFLALTGIGPMTLSADAGTPRLLSAVLDHLMGNESLLLAFSANADVPAPTIAEASRLLALEARDGSWL